MKETFDEEYDHYKRKRRLTNDSAGDDLSDASSDDFKPEPLNAVKLERSEEPKPMSNAERMMAKMGYKEGKGLGREKQGAIEPVALSSQRGRIGLGHEVTKAVGCDLMVTWDESKEEKTIEEYVRWLPECPESTRDWIVDKLEGSEWIQIGEKKLTIDDEAHFCDKEILTTMIKSKDVFDIIPDRDLRDARTRVNPYETIGGAFFQNRAAMKVANLDRVFNFMFSGETEDKILKKNPLNSERPSSNCDRETPLFYFADVCAGPGGFSEYMLWRKAFYNVKGFGFTLKGKDDFKLGKFTASSAHYFEPFYGKHKDGDVMKPENINSLEEFIMKGTNDVGVDLMMADGSFSVEGKENIQEILSKHLYLCQLLVSLCIVREGGNFFCKLFDVFTPFSAGLIYLMYVAYDQVALHKPRTSRPANSERYIICKGLRKNYSNAVRDYLKRVNLQLNEFDKATSSKDVNSIVPLETLRGDEQFFTYLTEHNERLAVRQSTYLKKYLSYAKNTSLIDKDQGNLREECMKYWLVPNKTLDRRERAAERQQIDPDHYFGRFARKFYGREDFNARLPPFTAALIGERIAKQLKYAEFSLNILSNRATTQPELLISTGDAVFVWRRHWERMENNLMRIPDRTVLLVERATTYKLVDGKKLESLATDGLVRVLDAAVINGDDVSGLLYTKRMAAVQKFCQALKLVDPTVRIGRGEHERYVTPPQLVAAEVFSFEELAQIRRKFSRIRYSGEEFIVYEENGHMLMCKAFRISRLLKESWKMGWSCSRSKKYAFCPQRHEQGSFFEPQWEEHECCSSFWESAMPSKQASRQPLMQCIWSWENSLYDNYGPRVILEDDAHKSGPTVNSVLKEVQETDEQCGKPQLYEAGMDDPEIARLEAALQQAVRERNWVTEASLSILQEKDALELKVAQLQTDYDAYKVEVDQDVKRLKEESSDRERYLTGRITELETTLRETEQELSRCRSELDRLKLAKMSVSDAESAVEEERKRLKSNLCKNCIKYLPACKKAIDGRERAAESQPRIERLPRKVAQHNSLNATKAGLEKPKLMPHNKKPTGDMGYKEGGCLGKKKKQAVVQPLFALPVVQTHFALPNSGRLDPDRKVAEKADGDVLVTWDDSVEKKTIEEQVHWMPQFPNDTRDWVVNKLKESEWMEIGERKLSIDDEAHFCGQNILTDMIKSKRAFDAVPDLEILDARTRANPYERIGSAFFMNRAAMTIANLDRVFSFMLSGETDDDKILRKNPINSERPPSNCDRQAPLFYFADICAGPGGFSEYMLWRKRFYNAKGFGFTLKGTDDVRLGWFTASSPHYFEPFYGKLGDGDVMKPENINSLEEFIMEGTNNVGVDLMMADGGYNVKGSEVIQEIISQRLYLCQMLASLCVVREGGNSLCKLFDVFTPFSAGLIYLMCVAYDQVAIHKPHNSRPANSERYIICKGLRKSYSDTVRDYLKRVNQQLDELEKAKSSNYVNSVVPLDTLLSNEAFLSGLTEHNERSAIRQTTYLQKYFTYVQNKSLIDKDQDWLRESCLNYWLVPNKTLDRQAHLAERQQQIDPIQYFERIARKLYAPEELNARLPQFTATLISERIADELKYAEFALNILSNDESAQPQLLISTGNGGFLWKKQWERMENVFLRIPDKTILLVERAMTYKLVNGKELEISSSDGLIRILDAAVLDGDDVSSLPYMKRMAAARKFCEALKLVVPTIKIGRGNRVKYATPLRLVVAEVFSFDELEQIRRKLSLVHYYGEEVIAYEENGHTLMCKAFRISRLLKESWKAGWSCFHSMKYAFCERYEEGFFLEPRWEEHGCCSSFWDTAIQASGQPPMQWIWSWQKNLYESYGPREILEDDSHKEGPTVTSLLKEVQKIDEQCRKGVAV